jgi:hypothetical protein
MSFMIPNEALGTARQGGWNKNVRPLYSEYAILDPSFWKALGQTLG